MGQQGQQASQRQQSVVRRQAREQRILDAVAALILRWGSQKVTLDDVARQAGVAKGTLYLHWKSREEILEALLQRERAVLAKDLHARIHRDSARMTLRSMVKHTALTLMERPLLKAVLLRDTDLLGELVHRKQSWTAHTEELTGFKTYLALLREQRLIRTDLSLQAQIYLFAALFVGCLLVAPLLPDELALSDEDLADLMAETVSCTLSAGCDIPSKTSPTIAHAFLHYLDQVVAKAQEPLQPGESS